MVSVVGLSLGYALMGVILGIVFSLLFIRNDEQWIAFATSAGSLGTLFVGYLAMNKIFVPTAEQRGWLFALYLLGFLISMVICVYVFAKILKTQSDKIKLRALDIILGRSKTLEEYYDDRRQEIRQEVLGELNADELIKQKSAVDLSIQRNEEILEKIKNTENQCIFFEIRIHQKYPITSGFVCDIPQFIEKWSLFVCEVSGLTRDFDEKGKKNRGLNKIELDAYFLGLCGAINKILFVNNPQATRSHVRILKKDESIYRKIVSVEGTSTVNKPMTDIPINEGMIFHAFREKSSLIKSYNPNYHFGKTNSQWYDYLTIPLYDIEALIDGQYSPFISLGIAIQAGYRHEEMLVFLHLMKIERFIQKEVKLLSETTDIYAAYNK